MSDHTVTAARSVPVEAIKAGLASVDWDMVRAGHADPKQAAGHAIRYAAVALRTQIAANIRDEMNRPERIEMADRYEGYFQGQRSGLETAARIAEKGITK